MLRSKDVEIDPSFYRNASRRHDTQLPLSGYQEFEHLPPAITSDVSEGINTRSQTPGSPRVF